jgi:hypothetical protein
MRAHLRRGYFVSYMLADELSFCLCVEREEMDRNTVFFRRSFGESFGENYIQ